MSTDDKAVVEASSCIADPPKGDEVEADPIKSAVCGPVVDVEKGKDIIDTTEDGVPESLRSPGKKKKRKKRKSKDNEKADVLQPGDIITPEVIGASEINNASGTETPQNPCVRPKSGKKSDGVKGGGRQDSKKGTQEGSRDRPGSGRKQQAESGSDRSQLQYDTRQQPHRQKSHSKGDNRPGSGKVGNRPGSGSPYRNDGNNRPNSGSPYRQENSQPDLQAHYQQRERKQYGQSQTPQGQNKQDRRYQSNRSGNGQGRNTPGGNSTPKDKQGGRGRNTPRNKQPAFEPYWPPEELQRGLKLGNIIQGPIRINPKNYEEAYIPHPDGVLDIFICGMKDRNRALNGDIVAVLLHGRDDWKIHVNNLKDLEEKHQESEINNEGSQTDKNDDSQKNKNVNSQTEDSIDNKDDDTDSEPDVIIESEEIIDLTVEGTSQDQSDNCKSIDQSLNNQSDNAVSTSTDCDIEGKSSASNISDGVQDISDKLKNVSVDSKQQLENNSTEKETPHKKNKQQTKETKKVKSTPSSVQKKYSTLQEVLKDGSDIAKNLFTTDDEEKSNSANRVLQRTGKVVAILEPKHSRASTGHIHLMQDKNPNTALFKPLDHRLPRIMVPMDNCPKDFQQRPEDHVNTLFICRIKEWKENSMYAHGELMRSLGEAGEIEPETEGILIENDVDYSEFTEEALSSLPVQTLPWQIPEEEIVNRRDFRQQCVFTIDPATARDLDDALSCVKLEDGTYDVGVHIADVSYFLKEDTALDKRARFRATSVYLVQKVIPMLPRILCEELCSLNPNQDRLTFSVVWNMSETGEIYGEWFGRTVIRSCVKLSYDHAQGFIEEPEKQWTTEELPPISDGYPISQIRDTVLNLQKIAKNLRKARFEEGALRLDQVKLQFTLDKDTGMPNGYNVYQQRDSNRLVEEFMLLANMAVAHKIKKHFPRKAFLRRHPPPQSKMVDDLVELCNNLGFPIDPSSAGTLQRSLWRYAGNDELSVARMQVLVSMCSKPMQNAKYFCTGCIEDEELYRHYALNVPLYTHFTSPIRRYADVMVHRTLAAALDYCEPTDMSMIHIQGIAENCNDRKTNSKRASELSAELFFSVFVKTAGPFEEKAMVMGVLDKAFDVFIMTFGVVKRVYCDKLALKDKLYTKEQKNPILTLYWEPTQDNPNGAVQRISIFTIVTCILKPGDLPLQWIGVIKPPKE